MTQRPTTSSHPEIAEAATKELWEEVKKWDGGFDPKDEENNYRAFAKLVRMHGRDGWCLAKALEEDFNVEPDSDLVEICEGYWFHERTNLSKAVRAWIEAENIKPQLAVGAVFHDLEMGDYNAFHGRIRGKVKTGPNTIVAIDEKEGTYTVEISSEGHGLTGPHKTGTMGRIIEWEHFEADTLLHGTKLAAAEPIVSIGKVTEDYKLTQFSLVDEGGIPAKGVAESLMVPMIVDEEIKTIAVVGPPVPGENAVITSREPIKLTQELHP